MITAPKQNIWVRKMVVILGGQVLSLLGSGLVQFAIIWWLTTELKSAVVLSLSMIMGVLPVVVLSPFAGVVADRYNRKTIMILADTFVAVITLLFALLLVFGVRQVWLIYILLFLRAAGSAFHQPAFESAIPMIAPHVHLVRVAALTQMLRSGINLLSPMLGALLVAILPLSDVLLIDVVTAGVAVLLMAALHLPELDHPGLSRVKPGNYMKDFASGLHYVFHWKGLMVLIIVFGLSNFLLAPMVAMMPLIITSYFQGGAVEYGFFEMALAAGLMAGGLTLSVWGGFRRKIVGVNIAQIACGLIVACMALVPHDRFYLVIVATVFCGITSVYVNSPVTAIFQSKVGPEMQGRVMSIVSAVCSLSIPLSLIIAGPLAEQVGLLTLVWLPGLLSALIGIACFFIPPLMHIESHSPVSHQPEPQRLAGEPALAVADQVAEGDQ